MIDLHSHTTASDGSDTPTELVHRARALGLSALGVTDHDTTGGLEEAERAAREAGLELVPGIELSVDYPHGEFHLLGYFIDYRRPDFLARVTYLQENRFNRNAVMLRKMREAGLEVSMEDVEAEAGGGQVGRPHMARALVRKGYAESVQDAFDRYLADGRPLHVPKVKLNPEDAIELIRGAGGLAVLAHPKFLGWPTSRELEEEIGRLSALGLDGLECYYSQHTEQETSLYLRIAERYGLLVSAGSDYHGVSKPDVHLGRVFRGQPGDPALLDRLRAAAAARRAV